MSGCLFIATVIKMTTDNDSNLPYIILGLGNPGDKYAGNRHNIGAQTVNVIARKHNIGLNDTWGDARAGEGVIAGRPVILARSRTSMNQSGLPARSLLRRTKLPSPQLLVLCDDLDLPLGRMRIRPNGGAAGQNGVNSVIRELGTQDFPRIRLGIGRPERPFEWTPDNRYIYERSVIGWVLNPFSKDEEPAAQALRERACEAVECLLTEGITIAMNRFN